MGDIVPADCVSKTEKHRREMVITIVPVFANMNFLGSHYFETCSCG